MDSIDVLGPRPDRTAAFTRALLSEAEDEELKTIVEQAARDLSTPIALVNLILEHIQFFKAHYGLPPALAAARGTDRDVSFCQFVVRDGEPFEVHDAEQDARVPQHLVKHYGIRSYLGIPVVANNIVVGSLCVIDTKPRTFSEEERSNLQQLAHLVNARLAGLIDRRRQSSSSLVERTAAPALAELRNVLEPLQTFAGDGKVAAAAIAPFLRMADYALFGGSAPAEALKKTLETAKQGLADCQNNFYDIEASAGDATDSLSALEQVFQPSTTTQLSEIAISGRELAQQNLRPIGGASLPDLPYDPVIATSRPLGVTLVATCLSLVAARMASHNLSGGIHMEVLDLGSRAGIIMQADELPNEVLQEIAAELHYHTGQDPTVAVQAQPGMMQLLFSVIHVRD